MKKTMVRGFLAVLAAAVLFVSPFARTAVAATYDAGQIDGIVLNEDGEVRIPSSYLDSEAARKAFKNVVLCPPTFRYPSVDKDDFQSMQDDDCRKVELETDGDDLVVSDGKREKLATALKQGWRLFFGEDIRGDDRDFVQLGVERGIPAGRWIYQREIELVGGEVRLLPGSMLAWLPKELEKHAARYTVKGIPVLYIVYEGTLGGESGRTMLYRSWEDPAQFAELCVENEFPGCDAYSR